MQPRQEKLRQYAKISCRAVLFDSTQNISLQINEKTINYILPIIWFYDIIYTAFFGKGSTMTDKEKKVATKKFADYWKDKGYEKGQGQTFRNNLLHNVFVYI